LTCAAPKSWAFTDPVQTEERSLADPIVGFLIRLALAFVVALAAVLLLVLFDFLVFS
jgi:hypothetical protein